MSDRANSGSSRRALGSFVTVLFVLSAFLIWDFGLSADDTQLVAAGQPEPSLRPESPGLNSTPPVSPSPPSSEAYPVPTALKAFDLSRQLPSEAAAKSRGCITCHRGVQDPHMKTTVQLGCVDCHGGDPDATDKEHAHVFPRFPDAWPTSANPVRSYTLLNHESPEFVQFVNPGDLRIAHLSCGLGGCHGSETLRVKKSMMTHGCMLWGSALYNNGSVPFKWARFGESYSMHGAPQRLQNVPPPSPEDTEKHGILPFLDPLPTFQTSQPGNILRIFERGGRFVPETGIPERLDDPGRPRIRLSNRGLGTQTRTDPVFVGLQKTRLFDPTLNFLGTNDHAGDYRSSGCTACHVVYANDRSVVHSGPYARFGNRGQAAAAPDASNSPFVVSIDPTIPKDEPGHPITHRFTRAIPTSQCIVCHIHPGTNVMNSYLGYMWWDEETDGEFLYPPEQKHPTAEEFTRSQMSNPDDAAARGNWSDPAFLESSSELNGSLKHTQFADFHGHGWLFRAVFKRDHKGNLLDHDGQVVPEATPLLQAAVAFPAEYKQALLEPDPAQRARRIREVEASRRGVPVHLLDIHLEKGMHCIDCHFIQDVHGDRNLYGEVRAAIEIQCIDCHGTVDKRAALRTSGPAAPRDAADTTVGRPLEALRTPFNKRRFERRGDAIIQNSMVEEGLSWEITQVADTINPASPKYNARAALAKTIRFEDGKFAWGDVPRDPKRCAHANGSLSCIVCHSSWNPSCYGCHLPQKANKKMPNLHNEGDVTRNYVAYNFQTLRDDVFMLAHDGNVTHNRIGPARSSCAVHVGSYNANRESVYVQQQTISGDGLSGIAFSSNVPHTVRGRGETKLCTDCHVSASNDNNAILAQLMMHGTNYLNWIGRYCWLAAGEKGLYAVEVTQRDEPQAVIGSTLDAQAFPQDYAGHVVRNRILKYAFQHPGKDISDNLLAPFRKTEVLSAQLRGEYCYAACGEAGVRIFDVAFIDDKGFSQRITTAPVSPLGQRFYVRTKYATYVAAPTTIAPDPTRTHNPENHDATPHPLYGYIYVADKFEGLILVGAATTIDGNPLNNFVNRALTFNPDGLLAGARYVAIAGIDAYVLCDAGLVVISLADPLKPEVKRVVGGPFLKDPRAVQVQLRYAFVCDAEGLKVLDVTDQEDPKPVTVLPLADARNVYVARTYAYVAGGRDGLIIVDVTNPAQPQIDQVYNAGGCINDLNDVKLGITYVSEFAYLADGCNGLRVLQLTSPETPGNYGFSPRPTPQLIATYPIHKGGRALAISKGLDRDRAVDESGNQIAVFGRVGARPLDYDEQRRLLIGPNGQVYPVTDGWRDFRIEDRHRREELLRLQLESDYGRSRWPDASESLPPEPPQARRP
jgi:hypothetical protein